MMMRSNWFLPAVAGASLLMGCSSGAKQGATGTNTPALQSTDRDLTSTVRGLLSAYEQVPNKDTWQKLDGNVPTVLEQIALDPNELISRRARALEVLGYYGETGVPLLRRVLSDDTMPAGVRTGAVTGVARALPQADAVPFLAKALTDKDSMVRFRTVLELKRFTVPEAHAALVAHAPAETDASVNRVLKEALASDGPTLPTTPGVGTPATTP